jgi:hypothetical protein
MTQYQELTARGQERDGGQRCQRVWGAADLVQSRVSVRVDPDAGATAPGGASNPLRCVTLLSAVNRLTRPWHLCGD